MPKTARGFSCEWCGKEHKFTAYVYAHMREPLVHMCSNCGATHTIIMATAKLASEGEKEKKTCENCQIRHS